MFLRTPQRRVHLWAIELKRKKHLDKRASWLWDYQMCPLWYAGSCEWSWEDDEAFSVFHLRWTWATSVSLRITLSSDEPSDRCQEPARFIEGAKQRSGETENKSIIPGETHISTGETEESADLDRVDLSHQTHDECRLIWCDCTDTKLNWAGWWRHRIHFALMWNRKPSDSLKLSEETKLSNTWWRRSCCLQRDDYVFTLSWRMPQWKQNLCFVLEESLRRKTWSCSGRIHSELWRVCFFCKRLQSDFHHHPNVSFLFTSWRRVRLQQQMLEGFKQNDSKWLNDRSCCSSASSCFHKYVTLEHRRSHKQHSYVCSNNQQYIVWLNIYFSFTTKIISILRSCSIKIFSTFPILKIFFD